MDDDARHDGYREDLIDFVRYGRLDAYDLTDEELAQMLEVWRWAVWYERHQPSAPDHDVLAASRRLQRTLAKEHDIEVEYNTALLMKQEIEPLMYLRVLLDVPRALSYFLRPRGWLSFFCAILQARRYKRIPPIIDERTEKPAYPRMYGCKGRAPDLLKRPYWRQLSPYTFQDRKKMDYWW